MTQANASPPVGRRGLLAAIGAAGLSASAPAATAASRSLPLTAQTTEGPYYIDVAKIRSDITEGLDGVPLEVRFSVLDAAGKPLLGAVRETHRRYVATLTVVVDPAAHPVVDRPPQFGGMPPAGGPGLFRGGRPERPQALDGAARTKALVPPRSEG